MIHNKNLAGLDIDLLTNIYVERNEKIIKDFNTHIFVLDFDSHFLSFIVK